MSKKYEEIVDGKIDDDFYKKINRKGFLKFMFNFNEKAMFLNIADLNYTYFLNGLKEIWGDLNFKEKEKLAKKITLGLYHPQMVDDGIYYSPMGHLLLVEKQRVYIASEIKHGEAQTKTGHYFVVSDDDTQKDCFHIINIDTKKNTFTLDYKVGNHSKIIFENKPDLHIEGSPYLFLDIQKDKIQMLDGERIVESAMNYLFFYCQKLEFNKEIKIVDNSEHYVKKIFEDRMKKIKDKCFANTVEIHEFFSEFAQNDVSFLSQLIQNPPFITPTILKKKPSL